MRTQSGNFELTLDMKIWTQMNEMNEYRNELIIRTALYKRYAVMKRGTQRVNFFLADYHNYAQMV